MLFGLSLDILKTSRVIELLLLLLLMSLAHSVPLIGLSSLDNLLSVSIALLTLLSSTSVVGSSEQESFPSGMLLSIELVSELMASSASTSSVSEEDWSDKTHGIGETGQLEDDWLVWFLSMPLLHSHE